MAEPATEPATEPAKKTSFLSPPTPPKTPASISPPSPVSHNPAASNEANVDRDAFYDEDSAGAGANRPQPKPPAKTVIYVDNKHRVSNDEGLILVVCGVCGTRAHFTPDKGETEQQCPDCFIKFKLPKLPPGPVKQAAPKIDDDDDEFKLADTFERHGYQPLTRDSVTADQIKGGPPPAAAFGNLGAPPSALPNAPVAGQIPMANAPGGQVIAPPLPPAFGQPSTPTSGAYIPEPIPPEATAALTAAGAAPSMLDPSHRLPRPPQWAILVDVFDFPFRPLHLLALISFTVLVMIPIAAAVFALATFPGRLMQILMIAVVPPLEAAPFVFVASYFVHIVHDSSYGEKQIQHWNAINLVDNGLMAIYVFCAIFFAGFPGFLISLPFAASEGNAQFLCILVSTVIFFPFCLLSLLEEESYWQVYNHEIAKSFRFSSGHVFLFACSLIVFTGVTGALMFGVGSILGDETSIPMTILALAAMVLVGMYWLFCYGRMVGRLAWVMNYEAQYGPLEDDD